MLNGIKSMILEKESYMEAAGIIFEDAAHGGIDDLIVLNEKADVPEDDEDIKDPNIDDANPGNDDKNVDDEEDDDIANIPLDDGKGDIEDGDNPDAAGVDKSKYDDILSAEIDGDEIQPSLEPTDDLPPMRDADDLLNISIDLRSNTIADVLPVPPDNANEAIADDILETRVDSGFSESVKDDCPTDDEIPEMRKHHGNGKSPQIGAIKKKLENGQKLTNREQVILRMHYSHKPPMNNARTSTDIYLDKVLTDNHGGKKVTIDSKLDSRFNESTDDIPDARFLSFNEETEPTSPAPVQSSDPAGAAAGFPMDEGTDDLLNTPMEEGFRSFGNPERNIENFKNKEIGSKFANTHLGKQADERAEKIKKSGKKDLPMEYYDQPIGNGINSKKEWLIKNGYDPDEYFLESLGTSINESPDSFLEAITLDGAPEEKPADGTEPAADAPESTPEDPGDPPAEEPVEGGEENEVTAAVKDKVAEADAPIEGGDSTSTSKEALLKKLGSISKGLEDAKKAIIDTIK